MGGDLLQGTVELMVLKALSLEPMHGWGIGQRLDQMSGEVFKVRMGRSTRRSSGCCGRVQSSRSGGRRRTIGGRATT